MVDFMGYFENRFRSRREPLDKDINVEEYESFYKNITLDLNGHTVNAPQGLLGNSGTCRVIDSSADKSGKLVASAMAFWSMSDDNVTAIFDGITCETSMIQYFSVGKLYVVNGTKVVGTSVVAAEGGGSIYIQDSTWTFAETDSNGNAVDGQALLENTVRTAQYAITKNADGSFTMTATDLGKAMRAFEKIDASAYTKTSYAAAKAIYDEIDGTVDEEYTAEDVAKKVKELNDALNNLQAPATAKSVSALKSTITAAKKLKSTDYTASTFKAFTTAITSAEKVLNNADHSEAQVTAATKSLAAAKAKLVKMKTQTITVSVKNTKGVVSKKYGDKAFYLGAKAKGGLTYKSSNTKIATVDSKGKLTYKKLSGTSAIAVSSTGRFTVKKGLKKGTYRVKVKITAAARGNYNAGSRTVTITVKVK